MSSITVLKRAHLVFLASATTCLQRMGLSSRAPAAETLREIRAKIGPWNAGFPESVVLIRLGGHAAAQAGSDVHAPAFAVMRPVELTCRMLALGLYPDVVATNLEGTHAQMCWQASSHFARASRDFVQRRHREMRAVTQQLRVAG